MIILHFIILQTCGKQHVEYRNVINHCFTVGMQEIPDNTDATWKDIKKVFSQSVNVVFYSSLKLMIEVLNIFQNLFLISSMPILLILFIYFIFTPSDFGFPRRLTVKCDQQINQ